MDMSYEALERRVTELERTVRELVARLDQMQKVESLACVCTASIPNDSNITTLSRTTSYVSH